MKNEHAAYLALESEAETRAHYRAVLSKPAYSGPKRVYKKPSFMVRVLRAIGLV